jgi:hypothetical protein
VAVPLGTVLTDLRELRDAIPISRVPDILLRRPGGRAVHLSTVYRWACRGIGGTKLRTFKCGVATYVLPADLRAFLDRLNSVTPNEAVGSTASAPSPVVPSAVSAELDRLGV